MSKKTKKQIVVNSVNSNGISILTYKVKHEKNFRAMLQTAKDVALFAVKNRCKSTKLTTSAFKGFPSAIANQIINKYVKNKKLKRIYSVKLTVPGQSIEWLKNNQEIYISCLKLNLSFRKSIATEIKQIEFDKEYAYISCSIPNKPIRACYGNYAFNNTSSSNSNSDSIDETTNLNQTPQMYIGVDLNATGHIAVVAVGNKIYKFGKDAPHRQTKSKQIREFFQKEGLHKKVKEIGNKYSRRMLDTNHKIVNAILDLAIKNNAIVRLENLSGIRTNVTKNVGKGKRSSGKSAIKNNKKTASKKASEKVSSKGNSSKKNGKSNSKKTTIIQVNSTNSSNLKHSVRKNNRKNQTKKTNKSKRNNNLNQSKRFSKKPGKVSLSNKKKILKKAQKLLQKEQQKRNKGDKYIKNTKNLNFIRNTWGFYQIKTLIAYKSKLSGILVELVNPAYTSQKCSRCDYIHRENRKGKMFACLNCKHTDHADANAAFNIAKAPRVSAL